MELENKKIEAETELRTLQIEAGIKVKEIGIKGKTMGRKESGGEEDKVRNSSYSLVGGYFTPECFNNLSLGMKDTLDLDFSLSPYRICKIASTDLTSKRFLSLGCRPFS